MKKDALKSTSTMSNKQYKVVWKHVSYTEPWSITLNIRAFQNENCKSYMKKQSDGSFLLTKYNWFQKNWRRFKLFIWRMKRKIKDY